MNGYRIRTCAKREIIFPWYTERQVAIVSLLLRFELLANAVRYNFAPVDLCTRNRQLSSKRLKSRIRHGLIILRNRHLVVLLTVFDDFYNFLGRLHFVSDDDGLSNVLGRNELNISFLVVVNLMRIYCNLCQTSNFHDLLEPLGHPLPPPHPNHCWKMWSSTVNATGHSSSFAVETDGLQYTVTT